MLCTKELGIASFTASDDSCTPAHTNKPYQIENTNLHWLTEPSTLLKGYEDWMTGGLGIEDQSVRAIFRKRKR